MNDLSATKQFVAEEILKKHESLFVHLNGTIPGVVVPERLTKKEHVVLQVGFNMPVPIPDLKISTEGVSGTLAFQGVAFWCHVPWDAVGALVSDTGLGQVYDESFMAPKSLSTEGSWKTKKGKTIPPYLRVVK